MHLSKSKARDIHSRWRKGPSGRRTGGKVLLDRVSPAKLAGRAQVHTHTLLPLKTGPTALTMN